MKFFSVKAKAIAPQKLLNKFIRVTNRFFYLAILLGVFLFTGCMKQNINKPANETQSVSNSVTSAGEVLGDYEGLAPKTLWELQQARSATAKYQHIDKAFADGYADINVVVPNMGYHFMKSALVDSLFEIRKPEILVYNKNEDGSFQLVAVEYAVPIDLSPNTPPEGFTGSDDVWERNTGFGLWLQHAWIWSFNPKGVFHDTNPLVQVH